MKKSQILLLPFGLKRIIKLSQSMKMEMFVDEIFEAHITDGRKGNWKG